MGRGWYLWTVLALLNPIMINFHRALDKSWNLSFILNLQTFLNQNMKCIIDLNLSFLINSGCEASFRIEYESPSIFIFSIFPIVMEKVVLLRLFNFWWYIPWLSIFRRGHVTPLVLFYTPWKHQKTRGRKRPVVWNRINCFLSW